MWLYLVLSICLSLPFQTVFAFTCASSEVTLSPNTNYNSSGNSIGSSSFAYYIFSVLTSNNAYLASIEVVEEGAPTNSLGIFLKENDCPTTSSNTYFFSSFYAESGRNNLVYRLYENGTHIVGIYNNYTSSLTFTIRVSFYSSGVLPMVTNTKYNLVSIGKNIGLSLTASGNLISPIMQLNTNFIGGSNLTLYESANTIPTPTAYDRMAYLDSETSNISFVGCSAILPFRAPVYYTIQNQIDTATTYYQLTSLNNITLSDKFYLSSATTSSGTTTSNPTYYFYNVNTTRTDLRVSGQVSIYNSIGSNNCPTSTNYTMFMGTGSTVLSFQALDNNTIMRDWVASIVGAPGTAYTLNVAKGQGDMALSSGSSVVAYSYFYSLESPDSYYLYYYIDVLNPFQLELRVESMTTNTNLVVLISQNVRPTATSLFSTGTLLPVGTNSTYFYEPCSCNGDVTGRWYIMLSSSTSFWTKATLKATLNLPASQTLAIANGTTFTYTTSAGFVYHTIPVMPHYFIAITITETSGTPTNNLGIYTRVGACPTVTTYDRYFTEVCSGRYNMNYCTVRNGTLWIGVYSPVAGIEYNITVLIVGNSASLPIQTGNLYLVDIRSVLPITFSMNVPVVSGVDINFISPNASRVYDTYLKMGLPGNASNYDYLMTTTNGVINSTYNSCNVDNIVGVWYYTIVKRGTTPGSYYTFQATYGQPAPTVTDLDYDMPVTASIPAGGTVFYTVYGALNQVISMSATETVSTNSVSIYVSQNTCPSAASYRYKRDPYSPFTGRYNIEWVSHSVNKHVVSIYAGTATTVNITASVQTVVRLTDYTTHTGWTGRPYEQILYSTFVPPTKQFAMYYRNNNHDFYIAQGYIPSKTQYDFSTVYAGSSMSERNLTLDQCAVQSANGTWYILAASNTNDTSAANFTIWADSTQNSQTIVTPLPFKSTMNITTTVGNFTFFGLSMSPGVVGHIRISDTSNKPNALQVTITAPGCPQVGSLLLDVPATNSSLYLASFVANTTALYVVTVKSLNSTRYAITASYGSPLTTMRQAVANLTYYGVNEQIGGFVVYNVSAPYGTQLQVHTTGYLSTYIRQGQVPSFTNRYLLGSSGSSTNDNYCSSPNATDTWFIAMYKANESLAQPYSLRVTFIPDATVLDVNGGSWPATINGPFYTALPVTVSQSSVLSVVLNALSTTYMSAINSSCVGGSTVYDYTTKGTQIGIRSSMIWVVAANSYYRLALESAAPTSISVDVTQYNNGMNGYKLAEDVQNRFFLKTADILYTYVDVVGNAFKLGRLEGTAPVNYLFKKGSLPTISNYDFIGHFNTTVSYCQTSQTIAGRWYVGLFSTDVVDFALIFSNNVTVPSQCGNTTNYFLTTGTSTSSTTTTGSTTTTTTGTTSTTGTISTSTSGTITGSTSTTGTEPTTSTMTSTGTTTAADTGGGSSNATDLATSPKKDTVGAIIGAVIGGLAIFGIIIGVFLYFIRRANNKKPINSETASPQQDSQGNFAQQQVSISSYNQKNDKTNNYNTNAEEFEMNRTYRIRAATMRERDSNIYLEDIEIGKPLGSGNFGQVYQGVWNFTTDVALKKLKKTADKQFENEFSILLKLNHPNIVRFLGLFKHEDDTFFVMEYLVKGSLEDYLRRKSVQQILGTVDLIGMALDVAAGMMYLESKSIIHRDLGARNLLVGTVDSRYQIKIADLGLARQISTSYYEASDHIFPVKWSPPEVILHRKFSIKSDIWSYGVCVWEIFSFGVTPFCTMSNEETLAAVVKGYRLSKPENCPDNVWAVVEQCWKSDPDERPTFRSIYQNLKTMFMSIVKPGTEIESDTDTTTSNTHSYNYSKPHKYNLSDENDVFEDEPAEVVPPKKEE